MFEDKPFENLNPWRAEQPIKDEVKQNPNKESTCCIERNMALNISDHSPTCFKDDLLHNSVHLVWTNQCQPLCPNTDSTMKRTQNTFCNLLLK